MKVEQHTRHLKVDKKIISLLSKSTYVKSFSNAIREMVCNAYDADALSVKIRIDKNNYQNVVVEDDGNGMTLEEFDHFCLIAGQKRNIEFTRKYKRKRIGQFGIGFLAVFPFYKSLEIISTVENSNKILKATIPTEKYFNDEITDDISEINFNVDIITDESIKQQHYTKFKLSKKTHFLNQYFSVEDSKKRATIKRWVPFEKFKWELEEDLPISFNENSIFKDYLKYEEPININVILNDESLYRHDPCHNILKFEEINFENINIKTLISTNYESIWPQELRGIKLRVNNVGVGERTDFGLSSDRGFPRLHWLNGEIMLSGEIKKFLSIDRDSFMNEPIIIELYEILKETLKEKAYEVDSISDAEKMIKGTFESSKAISDVKSKKDIIEKNLKILKGKGFKIKNATESTKVVINKLGKDNFQPISINKKDKEIIIFDSESYEKDEEEILGKKYNVVYKKWDSKKNHNPIIFTKKDEIEINEDYPLFKSRQYGNLFKKIHMILVICKNKSNSSEDMYKIIIDNFLKEFKDFQT